MHQRGEEGIFQLIFNSVTNCCSGYLSPEYAYCGHVSTKSDMYSFGVIVLEIVTGRRNNRSLENTVSGSLLSYVRHIHYCAQVSMF